VRKVASDSLRIEPRSPRLIETTFHPEYTYGDFVAKLLPQSRRFQQELIVDAPHNSFDGLALKEKHSGVKIEYHVHGGPLLKALALAFVSDEPVLLVIDEINRGNCAQIFGDMFQLLDRDSTGWSQYAIDLCDLHQTALEKELHRLGKSIADLPDEVPVSYGVDGTARIKLKLPPQLSLMGTMNTSDESVYYMDTAFKRRWDFQFMPWYSVDEGEEIKHQRLAKIHGTSHDWMTFLEAINEYIAVKFIGRNVDDKQVGLWFLRAKNTPAYAKLKTLLGLLEGLKNDASHVGWVKAFPGALVFDKSKNVNIPSIVAEVESYGIKWGGVAKYHPETLAERLITVVQEEISKLPSQMEIPRDAIRNKLMFFLWDNVFSRDRTLLTRLIDPFAKTQSPSGTFGDFATDEHLAKIIEVVINRTAIIEQAGE
jgi:hypothetical protein